MPKFLDSHPTPGPVLPAQVLQGQVMQSIKADILSGQLDRFGARPLNVFVSTEEIACLTEAPTPEAIIRCHEARGIRLQHSEIVEVTALI